MVDTMLGCRRVYADGMRCNGVAHFEGEGREKDLKYRCKKCGYTFIQTRGYAAGRHTFNLGTPGDKLRDSFK
jgi:transposase-like protein